MGFAVKCLILPVLGRFGREEIRTGFGIFKHGPSGVCAGPGSIKHPHLSVAWGHALKEPSPPCLLAVRMLSKPSSHVSFKRFTRTRPSISKLSGRKSTRGLVALSIVVRNMHGG